MWIGSKGMLIRTPLSYFRQATGIFSTYPGRYQTGCSESKNSPLVYRNVVAGCCKDLPDVLLKIEARTRFTAEFTHISEGSARVPHSIRSCSSWPKGREAIRDTGSHKVNARTPSALQPAKK
jgi:hypothetical protein